jgi:hypothetical protein
MRERMIRPLIIMILATGACSMSFAQKDTYIVRLTRPSKVGDRYSVMIRGQEHRKQNATLISGSTVNAEENLIEIEMAAVAEVQAVDGKQHPARIAYTMERCNKTEGGVVSEVIQRGRTVVAENRKGETVFTLDGKRAKTKVAEVLKIILSIDETESPSSDELFGTKERKLVGEEWNIQPMVAFKELKFKGIKVKPSDISGGVQLRSVRKHDDIDVLDWGGRLVLNNVYVPIPVATDGKMKVEVLVWGSVPVNPEDSRKVAESYLMKGKFSGRLSASGVDVQIDFLMERALDMKYSLVK